jgi:hypothetical protein
MKIVVSCFSTFQSLACLKEGATPSEYSQPIMTPLNIQAETHAGLLLFFNSNVHCRLSGDLEPEQKYLMLVCTACKCDVSLKKGALCILYVSPAFSPLKLLQRGWANSENSLFDR